MNWKTTEWVCSKITVGQTFSERRSERELIVSERERERRSNVQRWARARAHPKSAERQLALIFALKIMQLFGLLTYDIQIFHYVFQRISSNLNLFSALFVDFWNDPKNVKKMAQFIFVSEIHVATISVRK